MAKTPKNTKYFTLGRSGYFFDPPDSVFINAFNKNLTNKQLADRFFASETAIEKHIRGCLLYTSPSPRDGLLSRMPSSA